MTDPDTHPSVPTAHLAFLTGSKAGRSFPLGPGPHSIGRRKGLDVQFLANEALVSADHAEIVLRDGRYVLRDSGSRNGTLVNGERITEVTLQPGDVIAFGPGGPSARFVLGSDDDLTPTIEATPGLTASALLREARARAARRESKTGAHKAFSTTREFVAVAYKHSSRRARVTTAALLVATAAGFAAIIAWQSKDRQALQAALADIADELELERDSRISLEANLASIQTRYDSLLREVDHSRAELEANRVSATAGDFAAQVNRAYGAGVALIVSSYGFVEPGTDRLLRYQVDASGGPRFQRSRSGAVVPMIDFGGEGPPVSEQGSATGFLVDSTGWLLTNRHVATPWNYDDALDRIRAGGIDVEPRFLELKAYFPPGGQAYDLTVAEVSTAADVAVLRTAGVPVPRPTLILARGEPVPPGEPIVFMGYPTGVHNLLFRVDREERMGILKSIGDRPLPLAAELARRHLIQPLVIGGTISDTTGNEIIHTAGTTGGGSGGPIVGRRQEVVGIHYAAVRSPIAGDPFQTQRGVRVEFAWDVLPAALRRRLTR